MNILIETSPLKNANAIRGIGVYTKYLLAELKKSSDSKIQIFTSEDKPSISTQFIDIIHFPFFDLFAHTLPLSSFKFLKTKKNKIIVTIHDVIPLIYPEAYPVGIKGTISFELQKLALKNVDAIITDSMTSKNDIINYLHIHESKIFVIPLAGNPSLKKQINYIEITTKLKIPEKYVLYVGDINYNKNIPELFKAVELIDPSIHLVCIGKNFFPQQIPEWKAIEKNMGKILNRLHFLTNIAKEDNEQLAAIYTGAMVYVQPSLYEGFGLPILEAIQCETMVISSNTPALLELNSKGIIYVDPVADKLALAINSVFSMTKEEKQVNIDLNMQTLNQFSWNKTAKATIDVYQKVL